MINIQNLNCIVDRAVRGFVKTVEAEFKLVNLRRTFKQVKQFLSIDPIYLNEVIIDEITSTVDMKSRR